MDVNNRVIMGDGTALPRAEGKGGTAKVICDRMAGIPSSSGPTATSAANEVIADEVYYRDEMDELATLGSMEFEVLPADRTEKSKKYKPYDRPDTKKGTEKTVPEVIPRPRDPQPNRAYVELPPTILKCMPSAQVPNPLEEDKEMVDAPVPVPSKGKSRSILLLYQLRFESLKSHLRDCENTFRLRRRCLDLRLLIRSLVMINRRLLCLSTSMRLS